MLFWKGGRSKSWKTGPLQTKPGQFRPSEEGFKPGFKQRKRFFKLFLKKSDNKLFGPSTLNYNSIRGFHITSPKFKLRNYLFFFFFFEFLLSWGITARKNLYLHKFSVPKGSSFCVRRRLKFQTFAWSGM